MGALSADARNMCSPLGHCCGRCAQGYRPWQTGQKVEAAFPVAAECLTLALPELRGWAQQAPQADHLRVRPVEETSHQAQMLVVISMNAVFCTRAFSVMSLLWGCPLKCVWQHSRYCISSVRQRHFYSRL